MIDVVLIHPSPYKRDIYAKVKAMDNLPIAIWYLASYLKAEGLSVILIDFESDSNALEKLMSVGKNARLIAITMMTAQVSHGLGIAKFIKEKIGNIPIVVGGVHSTLYPTETVKSKYIDFTVQGEGEIVLFELISAIKENKRNYANIGGLSYKSNNKVFFNKVKNKFVDHLNYPDLDYALLGGKRASLALVTSRGCPYDCAFCCNKVIEERTTFKTWSLNKIMREVKKALGLGISDIFFWDDNFFQKKQRLLSFLEEIKKLDKKFTWFGNARADYFNERYISVELLSELNRNGLTRVSIGAESGSQRMLDYMQKGIKVDHILRAAEYCVKANIAPSFSFMTGLPNENPEDVDLTVRCIKKLCHILPLPKILGPALYLPLPGSKMFHDCERYGYRAPRTIEDWATIDSGYGFSAYDRPWIKNPDMVRIVWFYSILIGISFKKLIKLMKRYSELSGYSKAKKLTLVILAVIGSLIGKMRYRFRFFKFPVETIIFKKFRIMNAQ